MRTAEGLAINNVYLTGYSPYPIESNDKRLPHISSKLDRQIHKTALGAENLVNWQHEADVFKLIKTLRDRGFVIVALEQSINSGAISDFKLPNKLALVVGNEVAGVESDILQIVDTVVEIPMLGRKESFNVVQATAIALYHMRFLVNG